MPPRPGGMKERGHSGQGEPGPGRWREESPPAAWKPGASGATGVLSRWSAAAWGVGEAPRTPHGGEDDHQASPRYPQAPRSCPRPPLAAPRGPSLPPPALGQVWSASAWMRRKGSWAEPGDPLGGLPRPERGWGQPPRKAASMGTGQFSGNVSASHGHSSCKPFTSSSPRGNPHLSQPGSW